MEAAQAPIGQGPLRPAEGKDPKALQVEISRLMTSCEKLRARKRFFANKVEEINNPPPAPARLSSPAPVNPLLVPSEESSGAGAAQPSSSTDVPSPTSLKCLAQAVVQMHARTGPPSLPSSDQTNLVESWVVSPPLTRAATPTATARGAPHASEPNTGARSNAVNDGDVAMMDVSNDSPTGSAGTKPAHAARNASHQDSKQLTEGSGDEVGHHLSTQDCDVTQGTDTETAGEARTSRPDSSDSNGRQAEVLPLPVQQVRRAGAGLSMHSSKAQSRPASRPSSSHSMQSAQQAQHAQPLSVWPLSLRWADGVRAAAGVALAIGPWAHTCGPIPVTSQPVLADVVDLASAGQAEPHQQPEPCTQPGTVDTGPAESPMEADDQAEAAQEAGDRAEAVQAATIGETTPDDEGSSTSQMCNVCLCPIRQLIIVLQPCGHYYCENCTAAIRSVAYPRCPECRTRISSTFRVPLSSSRTQTHKEDAQHAQVRHIT